MRRKRTVKPTRYRSAAIAMFFVVSGLAAIAVLAAEWRESVVGVELDVRGISITTKEGIRKAAGICDTSNLASLDLLDIREQLLKNPFIRDVELTRDPPQTLRVDVVERKPIAVLMNVQARDWLLDEDGYVLPASRAATVHDLPVITGIDSDVRDLTPGVRVVNKQVLKGLQALKSIRDIDAELAHLFSEINLDHSRDLVLYTMEGGVPVILGSTTRLTEKMRSFRAFWENVAMKYDPTSLEYIDLRWKEQVVTRWRQSGNVPQSVEADSLLVDTTTVKVME
ncbi:MAG: cell division protein FtsQ/DivIB [Bacteroidetes bacterium]|nr:cell division protein FtsQ/DivIB [Bacteroidota bacterium]